MLNYRIESDRFATIAIGRSEIGTSWYLRYSD